MLKEERLRKVSITSRAGDLVLNSPFNGRISKPDYPLAWSIKRSATYLDDSAVYFLKVHEKFIWMFLFFDKRRKVTLRNARITSLGCTVSS